MTSWTLSDNSRWKVVGGWVVYCEACTLQFSAVQCWEQCGMAGLVSNHNTALTAGQWINSSVLDWGQTLLRSLSIIKFNTIFFFICCCFSLFASVSDKVDLHYYWQAGDWSEVWCVHYCSSGPLQHCSLASLQTLLQHKVNTHNTASGKWWKIYIVTCDQQLNKCSSGVPANEHQDYY